MVTKPTFRPEAIVSLLKEKGKKMTLEKGEYVFYPGDTARYVYCLEKGEVFISRMQEDGRERTHHIRESEERLHTL